MAAEPASTEQTAVEALTTQEKLLLAQAVYKVGAAAWDTISTLLRDHPVINGRPEDLFTPEACEQHYISLMTSIGQNVPAPDAIKPRSKPHLRLAQTFYTARLTELKETIESYETKFALLVGEINALKSGQLDDVLREEIRASLTRKYGKKAMEWVASAEEVKAAVESGPVEGGEVEAVQAAETKEPKVVVEDKASKEVTEVKGEQEAKQVAEKANVEEAVEKHVTPDTEVPTVEETPGDKEEEPAETDDKHTPKAQEQVTEDVEMDEAHTPEVSTPKPVFTPVSDLSDLPSVQKTDGGETPGVASSPTPAPEETTTRSSKRKASAQPKGAPAPKRSGRGVRAASAAASHSEAASEAEPEPEAQAEADAEAEAEVEVEAEPEAEEEPNSRERRQSRRSTRHDTPTAIRKDKDASPALSKRAPSASSTASAPPSAGDEKRSTRRGKGRGMRDEVVSKNVREQSAAVESAKEEEEEEGDEDEPRQTRARRGKKEATPTPDEKEDKKGAAAAAASSGGRRRTRQAKTPPTLLAPADDDDKEKDKKDKDKEVAAKRDSVSTRSSAGPRGPRKSEGKEGKGMQKMLLALLDTIQGHRNASVFQNPVKKSDAPNYYDIIKKPMDLKKVRQRIREGNVTSVDEFERDVLLIFANAMMYNEDGSQVYEMAEDMLRESENHIAHFRSTQADAHR